MTRKDYELIAKVFQKFNMSKDMRDEYGPFGRGYAMGVADVAAYLIQPLLEDNPRFVLQSFSKLVGLKNN